MDDFKGRHFTGEGILWAVRWYCRYGISYRDLEEMLAERGINVDHTTIYRWVQRYAPEMEKRLRWFWRRGFDPSWRLDETYVKVRGKWTYLYRAVDKRGDTIDFFLSSTRSAKAAKRFLGKALRGLKDWEKPTKFNTDKAPSYGAAIAELKREGKLAPETEHRQVKYLNNVLEADHGKLKMLIKPVRGFKSMPTAYATIKGFEVMRALRKGQARPWCARDQGRGASDRTIIWHWPLGHDRGHGHVQSAFRRCCLIPKKARCRSAVPNVCNRAISSNFPIGRAIRPESLSGPTRSTQSMLSSTRFTARSVTPRSMSISGNLSRKPGKAGAMIRRPIRPGTSSRSLPDGLAAVCRKRFSVSSTSAMTRWQRS